MLELNFDVFPTLRTERFILREKVDTDAEAIFAMRSDAEVMKYIGKAPMQTLDEARAFIKSVGDWYEKKEGFNWAICKADDNALIGSICLWNIQPQHYRAEVGYTLNRAYWRQGVLTEATKAVIDYGFKDMGLHSIEGMVHPDNTASIMLLEKYGFVKEAHFKENYFFNGVFEDTAVYSLLNK